MIRYRLFLSLCLTVCAVASSACSILVDSDRVQCNTDNDCTARGFTGKVCTDSLCRPDPTWACLDEPPADELPTTTVHINLTVAEILSQKPVPGVRLTLCGTMDNPCVLPVGQFRSDEAGRIDVELPAGFNGYFQTEGEGLHPALFFPPNTRRQRAPGILPMVPTALYGVMFSDLTPVDEERSVIMTTALDCLGKPAPGMILASPQADAQTVSYCLQEGIPQLIQTTDEEGAGGFVNIKPGGAYITATIAATNRLAGKVGVQTRPGYLTMVLVMPIGS